MEIEERAWIDRIAADPDDDRPRLVYADWLTQRGDLRGELIAVQCALARHEASDEEVSALGRLKGRERALLQAHAATWMAPAWALLDRGYAFRRGLIEQLLLNGGGQGRAYVAVADRLREVAPLLRAFSLPSREVEALAASPASCTVEEIELRGGFGSDLGVAARALTASPHLPRLRRLAFESGFPTRETALAFVALPHPLEELSLDFDGRFARLEESFVETLVSTPARTRHLRVLRIRQLRHLDEAATALATLPNLESIALENADLTPVGALALARGLQRLTSLDLADNYGESQMKSLDAAALLDAAPSLRRLRLAKLGLGDQHAIAIASSPRAAGLLRLDLARNQIGNAGALALARSEHLRGLRRLNLSANQIGEAVKKTLRQSPTLERAAILLR